MLNENIIDMNKTSVRKGEKLINLTLRIDEEMFQVLQNFTKEYKFNSLEETVLSILEEELFEHDDDDEENVVYEDNIINE